MTELDEARERIKFLEGRLEQHRAMPQGDELEIKNLELRKLANGAQARVKWLEEERHEPVRITADDILRLIVLPFGETLAVDGRILERVE